MEKTFTIKAELGKANIVALGKSSDIDRMLDRWEETLRKQSDPDHRDVTKDFVIQALRSGEHHRNQPIAEGVVLALTWLTANSELGKTVLPFMRAGDMALEFEITHRGGNTYTYQSAGRRLAVHVAVKRFMRPAWCLVGRRKSAMWRFCVGSKTDIPEIVAATMTPELVELERQLGETIDALNAVSRDIPALLEKADPYFQNPLIRKTDAMMAEASQKVTELQATREALTKTAADLRSKIALVKPAFAAAVAERLGPIRTQAANDIQIAASSLYAAVERFNATSEALKKAGANENAIVVPVRIPTLDHFVAKVAQG